MCKFVVTIPLVNGEGQHRDGNSMLKKVYLGKLVKTKTLSVEET